MPTDQWPLSHSFMTSWSEAAEATWWRTGAAATPGWTTTPWQCTTPSWSTQCYPGRSTPCSTPEGTQPPSTSSTGTTGYPGTSWGRRGRCTEHCQSLCGLWVSPEMTSQQQPSSPSNLLPQVKTGTCQVNFQPTSSQHLLHQHPHKPHHHLRGLPWTACHGPAVIGIWTGQRRAACQPDQPGGVGLLGGREDSWSSCANQLHHRNFRNFPIVDTMIPS